MFIKKDTRKVAEIVAAKTEDGEPGGTKKFKLARRQQEFRSGHINQLVRGSSKSGGLKKAEMVSLYNNGLTTIRGIHAFATAENLLHLNLGCNALKALPAEITQLKTLQELWLDDNLLEELPPTVLELDQLRVLRLSGNKMTALPPQIRMLQQLEDLACDANEIAELPGTLNDLAKLVSLNVRQNAIKALPALGDLAALEMLTASSNKLEGGLEAVQLGKLSGLKRLFVNGNQLSVFPADELLALARDGQLEKANFSSNSLELPLPEELTEELGDKLVV